MTVEKQTLEDVLKYAKFTVEVREKLMANYWKEMPELFQHSQSLINTLGLIAGFGFTAFQYIKSPFLFFLGEFLVIGSVLYLLNNFKRYIAGQPTETERMINDFANKAREIKDAIKEDNDKNLDLLVKEFTEKVNDTSKIPPVKTAKLLSDTLEKIFWLSLTGIILIFSSFIFCL